MDRNPVDKRHSYVRRAMNAELQLQSVLHRADAESFFDHPRHRDICSRSPGNQLGPPIEMELDASSHDLRAAVAYLQLLLDRMRASQGLPIVVDSNALLQCQRLGYVNWADEVNEEARLMLPLRVIEEIDDKSTAIALGSGVPPGNCSRGSPACSRMGTVGR